MIDLYLKNCPPRLPTPAGFHVAIASGDSQTVTSPRRTSARAGAVLHTGERSFVFRALGDGRFRPQPVEVGHRSGEEVEILRGLEPGDPIVISGTFLIASESRLRAALEQW